MKKIWFSQPLDDIWKNYHMQCKLTPGISIEQFCNYAYSTIQNNDSEPIWDMKNAIIDMFLEDSKQNFTHIFLEDASLEQFLLETKLSDLQGIKKYLLNNGIQQTVSYRNSSDQDTVVTYYFGIHVPYANINNGHAFMLSVNKTRNHLEFCFMHGHKFNVFSDLVYEQYINSDNEEVQEAVKEFRLALNLIAYMNCFPDCVRDGTPHITIDNGEKRVKKAYSVMTSPMVKEISSNRSVIPHFRRGYLKFCGSDFYKKARGKFILISAVGKQKNRCKYLC